MLFLNNVTIEGNLCQKPELKESANGIKYCRFAICYNQSKKISENEWENIPHFFNVVCYKKTAERVAQFNKGQAITVHGKLQYSPYTNKNGEKTSSISINAENVKKLLIDKKKKDESESVSTENERTYYSEVGQYEDEIPF